MSFSLSRRQGRRRRRWVTAAAVLLVFLAAAFYLYGTRLRLNLIFNHALTLFQQGHYDQALEQFNRILEKSANHPQAVDAIGLVYLFQGDLVKAEIKYDQAVKFGLRLNRRLSHVKYGQYFLSRGSYAPAGLEFKHALDLSPRDAEAHLGYALSLHAQGRLTDAIDAYRKAVSLDPDLKLGHQKLSEARSELERGFIYYIYDRRGTPLARFPVSNREGRRYYPLAQYASHVIGYHSEEHGQAGLERAFASYLPGNTVTLTIDARWQRAADQAMGWYKGSLVAIQPKTGEILALVNHPSYNPNRVDEDWKRITSNRNQPLKNRAFETLYTPGSIFKLVTAAAALETELNLSTIFPVQCPGARRFGDQTFWCWQKHGRVESLQSALDTSCNLAMAEIGFALGPDRLYEYANKFGFGAPVACAWSSQVLDCNLPIATSLAPMVSDDRFSLASRACGLGEDIFITPLHAALLAATVANEGRMPAPFVVKEIKNIRGDMLGQAEPRVLATPIQPETAKALTAFMVDAVAHGIGRKAAVEGLTVAGKTGTTGNSRQGLNGWFICFAPAERPQVALAVYAEKEGTGMDRAAPIAREFLLSILK
ncbi:MAG: penicillin-binding transpeptidase domain-containing protein [candidate division FCPU426 bacterium]